LPAELKCPHPVRFAEFEFDCHSGDLRRNDVPLRLQPQPARVLAVLIRRVGQVVSRQELVEEVWGSGTFVDFEQGLNYAIRQIRTVLGDDAEQPRFVETLPKRGYRFIAPLKDEAVSDGLTLDANAEGRLVEWRKTSWQIGIAVMVVSVISVALMVARLRQLAARSQDAFLNHISEQN
jgi:DNA-binding winged helix-turn-helix (wHTH) protein